MSFKIIHKTLRGSHTCSSMYQDSWNCICFWWS